MDSFTNLNWSKIVNFDRKWLNNIKNGPISFDFYLNQPVFDNNPPIFDIN